MKKEYSIAVYNVFYYKRDEDGNELLNADGSIKMFFEDTNFDYSYLADKVDPDNLKEAKYHA